MIGPISQHVSQDAPKASLALCLNARVPLGIERLSPKEIGKPREIVRISVNAIQKRGTDHERSTNMQYSMDLPEDGPRIGYVLQQLSADYRIEAVCLEGQGCGVGLYMGPLFTRKICVHDSQSIGFYVEQPPLGNAIAAQIQHEGVLRQIRHMAEMKLVYIVTPKGISQVACLCPRNDASTLIGHVSFCVCAELSCMVL